MPGLRHVLRPGAGRRSAGDGRSAAPGRAAGQRRRSPAAARAAAPDARAGLAGGAAACRRWPAARSRCGRGSGAGDRPCQVARAAPGRAAGDSPPITSGCPSCSAWCPCWPGRRCSNVLPLATSSKPAQPVWWWPTIRHARPAGLHLVELPADHLSPPVENGGSLLRIQASGLEDREIPADLLRGKR